MAYAVCAVSGARSPRQWAARHTDGVTETGDDATPPPAPDDETAMRLALLSGLVWLGWNKALGVALHDDPEKRERERDDLAWWVSQARTTLRAGLL